ncbi:DUF6348 family protein [Kordia sp.]|uniref:DUF6348 family protein n=1 Tax=Kordia sp. TaxID=1965332 RepID=UPI003D2DC223
MGFFDFLKPKKKKQEEEEIDMNTFLLQALKKYLETLGHTTEFSTKYAAIEVDSEFEIATAIMPGDFHPLMLPALIITIHPTYFPNGIVTNLTGIGDSPPEKVSSLIDDYITNIFNTFKESFKETHDEALDFSTLRDGKEILWHPNMSENAFQGTWEETKRDTSLFDLIKNNLKNAPLDHKFNALKLYIGRQPTGEISIECSLNSEQWEEGFLVLEAYAKSWKDIGEFKGQKQFIMLRSCDKFD